MTRSEFHGECTARTIMASQVLEESPAIVQALKEGKDERVRELLDQFA